MVFRRAIGGIIHNLKNSVLISYSDAIGVPPARQTARSLQEVGFVHSTLHAPSPDDIPADDGEDITTVLFKRSRLPFCPRAAQQIWNWRRFKKTVAKELNERRYDLVVTMMLHGLAALPKNLDKRCLLGACIYDIPAMEHAGRLDRLLSKRGWKRLREAEIVWASDAYKAVLAQNIANLPQRPLVCHNCPPLSYLPPSIWPRDGWLREQLRVKGARLRPEGGCIILRAGAIGPCGGIEETLTAMTNLPSDYVFLMMGRPRHSYKDHLLSLIKQYGLEKRAFLWDRPETHIWKRALQGADVGHLIHGPFVDAYDQEIYELNSSLSNNRLFQYMAAGLPIIAYNDPRMADLYKEVDCFRVADLGTVERDLRTIFDELGTSPDTRRALGTRAREAHLRNYNWENQFAPVLAACEAYIGSESSRRLARGSLG
jgi:glycosyltransferase involved in cell wall biosynthesis